MRMRRLFALCLSLILNGGAIDLKGAVAQEAPGSILGVWVGSIRYRGEIYFGNTNGTLYTLH